MVGKVIFPAAFKAAITSVHMEMFYRDFYNDGQYWAQKFAKNKEWSEKVRMTYHMTLAGLSRCPNKCEYLRPILNGNPILALNYSEFSALIANEKSFTQVKRMHLSTQDLIGPVKAFHHLTGAGNMGHCSTSTDMSKPRVKRECRRRPRLPLRVLYFRSRAKM